MFLIAFDNPNVEVVHVNDLTEAETLAHLLKYDSTYGVWDRDIQVMGGQIEVDGRRFPVSSSREIANVPWSQTDTQVVIESTGAFRNHEQAQQHIDAGVKKVLFVAPGKTPLDGDLVIGVNDDQYDSSRHNIISIGSCTANCLTPVAKVLHEKFHILRGLIVTTHAYTSTLSLLDGPHKDLRRARSGVEKIISTST